jgi:hypothetical protein
MKAGIEDCLDHSKMVKLLATVLNAPDPKALYDEGVISQWSKTASHDIATFPQNSSFECDV